MPSLPTRFFLYRITATDRSVRDDLFEPLFNIPTLEERNRTLDGERVTLNSFERDGNLYYGVMYRSQTQALVEFLSDRSGEDRPIPLDQEREEGLTGKTHFLYVPDYDILVLQSGRRSVPPGLFRRYLCRISGVAVSSVEIRPTLTRLQYERFEAMQVVSQITIAFEKPDASERLKNHQGKEVDIIRDAAEIGAYNVVLQLGRGKHRKNWLDAALARLKVNRYLELADDNAMELTSVFIRGAASEDDSLDEVDLIKDRMALKISVAYDERGLSTADAYAACREAYEKYAEDIAIMYERRH